MARPTPIVMNTPISGRMREHKSADIGGNLIQALQGLTMLANLYQGTIGASNQRDEDRKGLMALAETYKFGQQPPMEQPQAISTSRNPLQVLGASASSPTDDPTGGLSALVNPLAPVNRPPDLSAIAGSKPGAEAILKFAEQQNQPRPLHFEKTDNEIIGFNDRTGRKVSSEPLVGARKNSVHTQVVPDKTSVTGLRYNLYNPETGRFDIPDQPAPKPTQMDASQREFIRFDNLVNGDKSDPTLLQYLKVQGISPRLERAYTDYKKSGNAAVLDDAVLYAINKMNDPDSVVMIGEYLRTKELQSLFHSAQGNLMKVYQDSGNLAPKFREEFVNSVRSALKDKEALYDNRIDYYRGRGNKYNSDVEEVNAAFPRSSEKTEAVKKKESQGNNKVGRFTVEVE